MITIELSGGLNKVTDLNAWVDVSGELCCKMKPLFPELLRAPRIKCMRVW